MLQGFDEFMNLVIDDAIEVKLATKDTQEERRSLGTISALKCARKDQSDDITGQILLKGDNVSLIQSVEG